MLLGTLTLLFGAGNLSETREIQFSAISPSPFQTADVRSYVSVTKIIDGDTIDVLMDGKKETVRFIGIDTPEVHDPRKPVQCFGKEAWDRAKELLDGKQVRLEPDVSQGDRDKYNRLLRYVYLEDATLVNKLLIQEGYAHEYTYRIPYTYQVEFEDAERDAREQKRGLWADGVCL